MIATTIATSLFWALLAKSSLGSPWPACRILLRKSTPVWLQSQEVHSVSCRSVSCCREQQQSLFLAFVDLTKAFDLVSRSGLFKILQKIGCPPKLLAIITSFPVSSGVKQGCVLAPTLFGVFLSMLLQYAFVVEGCCRRSTSGRGQTANSSTSPDSVPKPKLTWCSYGSCCLQMMLL